MKSGKRKNKQGQQRFANFLAEAKRWLYLYELGEKHYGKKEWPIVVQTLYEIGVSLGKIKSDAERS